MFFEKYECEIACNTDHNTPHTYDSDFHTVLTILTWKTLCFTEKIHWGSTRLAGSDVFHITQSIKVAKNCFLTDWFYYNLIILIK